jgi:hypothetical protein
MRVLGDHQMQRMLRLKSNQSTRDNPKSNTEEYAFEMRTMYWNKQWKEKYLKTQLIYFISMELEMLWTLGPYAIEKLEWQGISVK